MRKREDLNFNWRYFPEFKNEYVTLDFNDESFELVNIPHTNIELPYHYFDEQDYQFISCYRKKIFITEEEMQKSIFIYFEGVMCYSEVYVNGLYVGNHYGGYTPFSFDITPFIQYNQENTIVLKVDSTERSDIPPFGHVIDYLTYGGIYREVYLEYRNPVFIESVVVKTKEVTSPDKQLETTIILSDANPYDLKLKLYDDEVIIQEEHISITHKKTHKQMVKNVICWELNEPKLYYLVVELYQNEELMDIYKVRFGFREVSFKQDGFYLNHKKRKLIGLNRHQSYPYVGYAMPKHAQYEDAEILKYQCGVNIVRSSHYLASKHFLNRCDEIGLLVFEEIPGWQHIGDANWQKRVKADVHDMIKRDINHPSIVLWGVRVNESPDCSPLYEETNRIARMLDDTRPTGGVRNFAKSECFEDVYTFNDFTHRGNNQALSDPMKTSGRKIPYLVTEYNGHMYPTKKFDQEVKRVEHALRHLRVLNAMYKNNQISGAIGWCMFDYNTHKDFGSGDKICYHGVLDMFRIPKYAKSAYASQQSEFPYMNVLSTMNIGEWDASNLEHVVVLTNCEYIKIYKNDEFIGKFYPNQDEFKNLPHPPIIVSDLIGDALLKDGFKRKDAHRLKKVFKEIQTKGKLSVLNLIRMAYLMLKYRLNYQKGVDLYTKHVINWGSESVIYRFEGYIGDACVSTIHRGASYNKVLCLHSKRAELIEDDTYDVARIEVKLVDEYEHDCIYDNSVVDVEVNGPLEVIGPKSFSLIGGSRAFWVKTKGQEGLATVVVKVDSTLKETIQFKIYKRV